MTNKSRILGLVLVALAACGDNKDGGGGAGGPAAGGDGGSSGSSGSSGTSGGAVTESAKKGTVKVSKAGGAVVEYTATGVEGNIDGDQIYFELNSPDTKQVLHLTIHARAAGAYDFAEKGTAGKAHILFITEDKLPNATTDNPVEWSPLSGKLTLDTATDKQAKGTFTGNGTPDGETDAYTVEGTFDVPLHVL
jgi:hypothetical protein